MPSFFRGLELDLAMAYETTLEGWAKSLNCAIGKLKATASVFCSFMSKKMGIVIGFDRNCPAGGRAA